MVKLGYISLFILSLTVLVACEEEETTNDESIENIAEIGESTSYDSYAMEIDMNDSLTVMNSMFYTNQANESVEVVLYVNESGDSTDLLKMEERMVKDASGVISTNVFYYRNGEKYITLQYYPESENDSLYFVEKRSYYDEKGEVIMTKRRTAVYEEMLEESAFVVVNNESLSDERAFDVVNQNGQFETTFQGFIDMDPYLYLLVGENTKEGYVSALIVQSRGGIIKQLIDNETEMLGTPLVVNFGIDQDGSGKSQILLGVAFEE